MSQQKNPLHLHSLKSLVVNEIVNSAINKYNGSSLLIELTDKDKNYNDLINAITVFFNIDLFITKESIKNGDGPSTVYNVKRILEMYDSLNKFEFSVYKFLTTVGLDILSTLSIELDMPMKIKGPKVNHIRAENKYFMSFLKESIADVEEIPTREIKYIDKKTFLDIIVTDIVKRTTFDVLDDQLARSNDLTTNKHTHMVTSADVFSTFYTLKIFGNEIKDPLYYIVEPYLEYICCYVFILSIRSEIQSVLVKEFNHSNEAEEIKNKEQNND